MDSHFRDRVGFQKSLNTAQVSRTVESVPVFRLKLLSPGV